MNDADLFAFAPFDPTDWLTAHTDDQLGAPWDVVPVGLPPLAGAQLPLPGAPNPLDLFRDLWGRASDVGDQLGQFIADAFATLWDELVWPLLGGAVRFVWNGLVWIGTGITNTVKDAGENVLIGSRWLVEWLWDRTSDMGRNVLIGTRDLVEWLWDRVEDAAGATITGTRWLVEWLWDRTSDMGRNVLIGARDLVEWLWDRTSDMGRNILIGARDLVEWLWDRVQDAAGATITGVRWLVEWLRDQTQEIVAAGAQLIATPFQAAFDWIRNTLFDPIAEGFDTKIAIPGKLFRGEYGSLEELWDDLIDPLPVVLGILFAGFALTLMLGLVMAGATQIVAQPLFEPAVQRVKARVGAELPAVGQILEGRNRQLIDAGNMNAWLSRLGFGAEQRVLYDGLRHQLPPPTDLIRFAVREVFDPVQAEALSLYDDFPERFAQIMEFQGFGPSDHGPAVAQGPLPGRTWAEAYWAAHWDLPSPSQGYEMLHRQVRFGDDQHVFNQTDLRALLRALDVAPVWRDPLIQIAYNPITRVDIRRMFAAGILNFDQVVERYKHLGYTDEDAIVLANFAVSLTEPDVDDVMERRRKELSDVIRRAYKRRTIDREDALDRLIAAGFSDAEAEFSLSIDDVFLSVNPLDEVEDGTRNLTQSTIIKAYRVGLFDRDQAQQELEIIGYQPASADLLLSLEDFARAAELTELQVEVVRDRYLSNSIPRELAASQLEALGVVGGRQFETLVRWDLERQRATRRLTPTQTLSAWERGIFDDDQVYTELQALGYSERDALVLVALRLPNEAA